MKKILIGASSTRAKWLPFTVAIKLWTRKPYSHVYVRFSDPETNQIMVYESASGNSHVETFDNWLDKNESVMEIEIDVSDENFMKMKKRLNESLQVKYSIKNIIGIVLYDLGLKRLARFFKDKRAAFICSEEIAVILRVLGIKFNRPLDFVRPHDVMENLEVSGIGRTTLDKRF